MKKNYIYIILVILLVIVAAIYYFNDKTGTLNADPKTFSISDTTTVTRVTIHNNGDNLIFDRRGKTWLINGKYKVKPVAMNALLNSLMNFEISAPVPKTFLSQVRKDMTEHPLIITIFSGDKIIKKYHITDNDNLQTGSYMLLEGQVEPYAVHMSGFEGRLSVFFTINPFIWRDRVVFSYAPGEILSVEVRYTIQPGNSFIFNASDVDHLNVISPLTKEVKSISREDARNFLMNFSNVSFDWIFSSHIRALSDSLNQVKPFCEIRVRDSQNRISSLRTYQIPAATQRGKFNPDRLYGIQQQDSIPLLMKYVDLDPILKTFQDFKKE